MGQIIYYPQPGLLNFPNAWTASETHSGLETFSGGVSITGSPLIAGQLNSIVYVDGTTYTTIASAIAALPAAGGMVVIPEGTYTLSSTLLVPSCVILQGAGFGSSSSGGTRLVAANGSVSPIVSIQGASAGVRSTDIFIRDLSIVGVYTASQIGLNIDHATYIVLENVQFINCGQAEWINDCYRCLHKNVSYYLCGSGGTAATATVRIDNQSNPSVPTEQTFFHECAWQGDAGGKQGTAIWMGSVVEEIRLVGCKVDYSGTGMTVPLIYAYQTSDFDISHSTISGGNITTASGVIYITGNGTTRARTFNINNCFIGFTNTVPGIYLDYATNYSIHDNIFQGGGAGTAVLTTANTFGGQIGPLIMFSADTPVNDVGGFATIFYPDLVAGAQMDFKTSIALGTNPAQTGLIRMPNAQPIYWRNGANTADYGAIFLDSNNTLWLAATAVETSAPVYWLNKFLYYNGVATVKAGVPSLVASTALATQAAAQSGTALFTPGASGLYRVSFNAKVTQAASGSSALGGAGGFSVTYTDAADSTASTVVVAAGGTNAGNALTSAASGAVIINAKTSVAVTFSYGYTSAGVTPMQYEIQVLVEALG